MVLNLNQYDAAYFGDIESDLKRKSGYSNYLELHTNYIAKRNIKKFLIRHAIPKNAKVLELGAAVGFMGKVATQEGYTNWMCVDVSSWCKKHKVFPVTQQNALSYLRAQANNSFDYIITRALIECIPANQLQNYAIEAKRVAKKQIHTTYIESNTRYYIVKTLPEWTSDFHNDPDIIIEDYYKYG